MLAVHGGHCAVDDDSHPQPARRSGNRASKKIKSSHDYNHTMPKKHINSMRGPYRRLKAGSGRAGIPFALLMIGRVNAQECAAGQYRANDSYAVNGSCAVLFSSDAICQPCPGLTYSSDGITCQACPAGTGPTPDQTACVPCGGNNHSTFGVCLPCPYTQVVVDENTRCSVCPFRQTAIAGASESDKRQCGCDTGFYNESAQLIVCFDKGYDEIRHEDALRPRDAAFWQFCQACTTDRLGNACMECEKGAPPHVRAGYTIPQLPAEELSDDPYERAQQALTNVSDAQLVFRCHDNMDIGAIRCPADPESPGQCAEGYTGYLCATCAEDYGMMPSRMCEPCEGTGYTLKSMLLLAAIVVGLIIIVGLGIKYWRYLPAKYVYAVRCAFQPMRIVITYAQVTSQLGDVLNFQYPPAFAAVIDAIRPIMDVWGLLFRALGSSECFGLIGFSSRWLLRVVALPALLCLIVWIVYSFERRQSPEKARIHAKGNLFFATFFCCEPFPISSPLLSILGGGQLIFNAARSDNMHVSTHDSISVPSAS